LVFPVGTAIAEPDFTLNAQAPSEVTPGESFTVVYTIENTGTTELSSLGLQATDLSDGLTITDVSTQNGFPAGQDAVLFQTVEPEGTVTAEFTVQVDSEASGDLSLAVEAANGIGEDEITRSATTVVTAVPINEPPTADAGPDRTVDERTEVQLNASNSSDPDGDTLSYQWSQTGGPDTTLASNESATPTFSAPEVDADTTLSFQVQVSDGNGGSDVDDINVTVEQVNRPPVADAGSNQSVNESTVVTLDGSESTDPDGDSLSYTWTQVSGPSVDLSDDNTVAPEFTAPTVSTATDLVFRLMISDENGEMDNDTVTVAVGAVNDPPVADAGPDQEVNETTEVQLNASDSTDPDGDVVTYSWTQIAGPSVTLSNNLIETPTFTAPEVDTDTTLVFEVTANDGNGGADTDVVNVTVAPTNNAPVADAGPDQMVNAMDTVQLDGSGSTDPNSDNLSYAWEQVGGPSVELSNTESATPIFTAPGLDTQIEVVFELQVTDGDLTDTDTVNVTIEPSLAPANFSVSELSAPASVEQGDSVTVAAEVTNTGDFEGTQSVEFRLDTDASGTLDENEVLVNETVTLASGENESIEFEVPTDDLDTGTYLHGVVTANDSQTTQLNITEVTTPASFSVDNLEVPSTVTQGESVTVTADITNVGGLEGTQTVEFRLDTDGSGVIEEDEAISSETVTLDTGETQSVVFEVSTDSLESGTYLHGVATANDSQTAQLNVAEPTPANFSVTTLSAPASVTQGENLTVTVGVTNVGDRPGIQSVDVRVDLNDDGILSADETVRNQTVALEPGDSAEDVIELSTEGFPAGTFTYGLVTENDTQMEQIMVVPTSTPANFSVTGISAPTSVTAGDTVTVTANVTNVGGQEGSQAVSFRLDTDGSGTLEGDEIVANQSVTLGSGENQPVEFDVSTEGLDAGTYLHGLVTDNDSQKAQITVSEPEPSPTPTPDPSPQSDGDDERVPSFSSELDEQDGGAVVEFSDATANRRYTVDLGSSIQSNDVTVTGTEMFFDRSVSEGTLEFSASGDTPDDAEELAGSLVYLSVQANDVSDDDLTEVEIEFTVPLSVLDEQDIDPEDVQLYRFEGGQWVAYETRHEGGSEFVADGIPGYSVFAIGPAGATQTTSQQTATATATPESTATTTSEPTETATPEPTETETPGPIETETAAPEPTDTATPTAEQTTSTQFPGFTPALAVMALLVAALLARRRLEGER
jgi:PGF-pre-PGF domain-containing protein/PGF-CTERM protein